MEMLFLAAISKNQKFPWRKLWSDKLTSKWNTSRKRLSRRTVFCTHLFTSLIHFSWIWSPFSSCFKLFLHFSNQFFKKFEKNNLQGLTLSLSRCSMFHPTRNNGAFSTTYATPGSENLCPSFKFVSEKMMLKVLQADYCSKSWQENESLLRAAREQIEVISFNTCAENSTLMTIQNIQG